LNAKSIDSKQELGAALIVSDGNENKQTNKKQNKTKQTNKQKTVQHGQ
jgi:hypothetical protein